MPTRDDVLEKLLTDLHGVGTANGVAQHYGEQPLKEAHAKVLDAIHAHVEARVAAAFKAGVAVGRGAPIVLRVEMPKPEPPQFIIAGGDSFPAAPVQATKSFASTNHGDSQ